MSKFPLAFSNSFIIEQFHFANLISNSFKQYLPTSSLDHLLKYPTNNVPDRQSFTKFVFYLI